MTTLPLPLPLKRWSPLPLCEILLSVYLQPLFITQILTYQIIHYIDSTAANSSFLVLFWKGGRVTASKAISPTVKACPQDCATTTEGGYWSFLKLRCPFNLLIINTRGNHSPRAERSSRLLFCIWRHMELVALHAFCVVSAVSLNLLLRRGSVSFQTYALSRTTVWATPCFKTECLTL